MSRRFVDLSIPIENGNLHDPPGFGPQITYYEHQGSFEQLAHYFPGLERSHLPEGQSWAVETIALSTHNGTHMDAPWHFHATQDAATPGGPQPAMTIDETPLEWCFRPGVKLDFRAMPDGYVVGAKDIEAELERIGYTLAPLDIVVVNTRAGSMIGRPGYVDSGCGVGREATLWLTERGVKIVGTDAWSWDAPFSHTARRWAQTRDPSIIWEGHKAGRERAYWQMEKLANLERLPSKGFDIICFPVKIKAASAGWTRAVALLPD